MALSVGKKETWNDMRPTSLSANYDKNFCFKTFSRHSYPKLTEGKM